MKTAAIVAASEFNEEVFKIMDHNCVFDYCVAVDAGYQSLKDIERRPDIAVGDFDSLGKTPHDIRTVSYPQDKDESDLELAFKRLRGFGYQKVFVFGALGRRTDHTVASMRACAFASTPDMIVEMIGMNERIVFLTGETMWECESYKHDDPAPLINRENTPIEEETTVSILPMRDPVRGLFMRGFKWEKDDFSLSNYATIGLSNKTTGEPILIGLESGTIAIIINK